MSSVATLEAATALFEGTFERDSLVWTFGKLAERILEQLFQAPCFRERYARWLLEKEPAVDADGGEQGLVVLNLELRADGRLSVIARPTRGEFVVVVNHPGFHAVIAAAYGLVSEPARQDGVCVAHFEGEVSLATRWALGLDAWLERQRR